MKARNDTTSCLIDSEDRFVYWAPGGACSGGRGIVTQAPTLAEVQFSRPFAAPGTLERLAAVHASDHAHGDGPFTRSATEKLSEIVRGGSPMLTTSGTHALEMASRLIGLTAGDEVILPSYTFPSAATAVAMTGAQLVFVDIDEMTGNIAAQHIEEAVTDRTKAISVMHYGGTPVDMLAVMGIARDHGLAVIEDNAHGLGVRSEHGVLGRIGDFGAQSFHDTKNVHAGEGGALLVNDSRLVARAEIIREKGTDRSQFLRGAVDKYSWVGWGSSYLPSEYNAAVLDAQLEAFDHIQRLRHQVWNRYSLALADWASHVGATLMNPPRGVHAAHLFFARMASAEDQRSLIAWTRAYRVVAASHYVPLHSSAAGHRYGRTLHALEATDRFSSTIVRLPLWAGMDDDLVSQVIDAVLGWRPTKLSRAMPRSR